MGLRWPARLGRLARTGRGARAHASETHPPGCRMTAASPRSPVPIGSRLPCMTHDSDDTARDGEPTLCRKLQYWQADATKRSWDCSGGGTGVTLVVIRPGAVVVAV